MESQSHSERITDLMARLDEATTRFVARIERAGPRAEVVTTGWTVAQIAMHVALVNDNFTSIFDGSNPAPQPPAATLLNAHGQPSPARFPRALTRPLVSSHRPGCRGVKRPAGSGECRAALGVHCRASA